MARFLYIGKAERNLEMTNSMNITRDFTLTFTESEHSIVEYDILRPACEKLGIELTYRKFEPHIPMKRYVRLHGDLNAVEALTVLATGNSYDGKWINVGNDITPEEYPYLSLQTWYDADTAQYDVRMYDKRSQEHYPAAPVALVREARFFAQNSDAKNREFAQSIYDELLANWGNK